MSQMSSTFRMRLRLMPSDSAAAKAKATSHASVFLGCVLVELDQVCAEVVEYNNKRETGFKRVNEVFDGTPFA